VDNISKDNTVPVLIVYPRLIYKIIVKRFGKIRKLLFCLTGAVLKAPYMLKHLILLYPQSLYHIENPVIHGAGNNICTG
jgi:hypothetical protein